MCSILLIVKSTGSLNYTLVGLSRLGSLRAFLQDTYPFLPAPVRDSRVATASTPITPPLVLNVLKVGNVHHIKI
jgi:hypothetical protein